MNQEYRWYRGWRKYLRVFNLGWQEQLEYRANHLLESLIGVIAFLIFFFLWRAIFRSNHNQPITGMTFYQMLTYLLLAKFWDWIIDPSWEIDHLLPTDIRNGGLNRFLIRPISDRLYRWHQFLAHKISYGMMRIIPAVLLLVFFPHVFVLTPNPGWWWLPLSGFLALLLQFILSYTIATIAFWWLEIEGILFLKRLIISLLSGAWLPLTVLPAGIAKVLLLFPFNIWSFSRSRSPWVS
jgi:ABC-2 type transport system permease protein